MLRIEHKLLSSIWKHAAEQYPSECCGVLLGEREDAGKHVVHTIPCRNVHDSPNTRYSIAPAELISVQRDGRDLGLEIVGFYHSHPDHPPVASETDLAEANWNGCSYLIVSVVDKSVKATRSYELTVEGDHRNFVVESIVEAAAQS